MALALEGVRILDLTDSVVGPFCGLLLASCGAEVIKVESRNHLGFRRMGPWGPQNASPIPQEPENLIDFSSVDMGLVVSPNFSQFNREKLSVSLNLSKVEGRDIFKNLVKISDVVIENFSYGVMQKWGFDYAALKEQKEDIIYTSIPSFGKGPKQKWTTWGMNLLTYSGFTYQWGHPQTAMVDRMASGFHGDYLAGIMSAAATVSALYNRALTGQGQFIEMPQAQSTTAVLGTTYLDYFVNGNIASPIGNRHPQFAPYNSYRCRGEDSWCIITVFNEIEWERFCRALDNPEWSKRKAFKDMESRLENVEELDREIERWTVLRTPHQVMKWLQYFGIAAGAVQNQEDIYFDLQLRERGSVIKHDLPRLGTIEMEGVPLHLSDGQKEPSMRTSILGEHNNYVYGHLLGMSLDEISQLEREKTIY